MERAEEEGTWKNVWGWDGKLARWPHSGVGGNEERGRVIPGFGFRGSLRGQTTKAETRVVDAKGRISTLQPPPRATIRTTFLITAASFLLPLPLAFATISVCHQDP